MNLASLRIGTFNLYNLNEPGLPVYTDKDGWSQAEYDRKIVWTSRVIATLKPDVFGFQELWHANSLARALEASGPSLRYARARILPSEQGQLPWGWQARISHCGPLSRAAPNECAPRIPREGLQLGFSGKFAGPRRSSPETTAQIIR